MLNMNLSELCQHYNLQLKTVHRKIDSLIVVPLEEQSKDWIFTPAMTRRIQIALRFRCNFGVNYAGATLALDFLHDIGKLKKQSKHHHS
ncbi:MAG: hypothetical protein ACI8VC_001737 [Candidatus Endobugula sp.]|jgi:hypothetical protein